MKKIKIILLLTSFTLLFISCNDDEFLDEMPVSSVGLGSFYQTEDQFVQAVNGIYSYLMYFAGSNSSAMYYGSYWVLTELRSDNSTFQYNDTDNSGHPWHNIDKFVMASDNGITTSLWNMAYEAIGRCNYVISESEGKDFDLLDRCVAEAKFLRALFYFQLVRTFGDVPLITEPVTSYGQAWNSDVRVDKPKIYELINSDLNDAIAILPSGYSDSDLGRATSGAARTLQAKAYMWQENYTAAETELEAVISSGEYSLLPGYASVFDIDNENNDEIIFSVQYLEGNYDLESFFMYRFLPWNSGTSLLPLGQSVGRTGLNIPTTDLMNSFEPGDDRKNMIDTIYIDRSFGTYHDSIVPYTKKFMDPNHSIQYKTGNDFSVFRYPHVLLMLAECYVRTGGGDPLPLINQVRFRAKLPDLANVTLDDIMHERRVEFHCECDRWDVLTRFGKVKEVMIPHGKEEIALRPTFIESTAYQNIKILYPIPDAVIALNPDITQNEEYQ